MKTFNRIFGKDPTIIAEAPGRVNLIGEHTDYNAGFVLPAAIPQKTRVELSLRSDRFVHVMSANIGDQSIGFQYLLGEERSVGNWTDYIQGVSHVLSAHGFRFGGFDAYISSQVPLGSGLSSSAALEVSLMRALREAFMLPLDDVTLAKLSQAVENDFVGARVGIMDQMAASLLEFGTALFLDAKDLSFRRISIPFHRMDLVVISSGIAHSNLHSGYNQRREECESVCKTLGIKWLRDLGIGDLSKAKEILSPTLYRRAKHVITENQRVIEGAEALQKGDIEYLGELFKASHASMRDDYQVSLKEIDILVNLANAEPGVYGARLTGGGFGGSVVILTQPNLGKTVSERVAALYRNSCKASPQILIPEPTAKASHCESS